jgi:tetratricopeptide (TPR) repeat protein
MRRLLVIASVLSAVLAQVPAPALASSKEEAKQLFESGLKLMKADDFAAAAAIFERSVALYPTQNGLFNLANCYKAMERYPEALEALARLRRDFSDKLNPIIKEAIERQERELQSMVARLAITTEPGGARVTVDGRDVGTGPALGPLVLTPGEHELEAAANGHRNLRRAVRLAAGESRSEVLQLAPEPSLVDLRADVAGAAVLVDGVQVGQTPLAAPLSLPPGNHAIVLRAPGHLPAERQIEIKPGESQVLDITLPPFEAARPAAVAPAEKAAPPAVELTASTEPSQPRARLWRVLAWSSAAAAVASGAAALVFWKALADPKFRDAINYDRQFQATGDKLADQKRHAAFDSSATYGAVAVGCGIGAGVFALTAVGAYFFGPGKHTATESVRVSASPIGLNVSF